jgi:hypothetical protein
MLHVTCDLCGKQLRPGEHMEAVSQLIRQMEAGECSDEPGPTSHHLRYDLCPDCRQRYLRDPLSKDAAQKFDFSEN